MQNQHSVVIVGGGPTGMMLAAELALAGVDALIVERRSGQEILGTRSRGLHARTIEVFDQRGIAERFLAEGRTAQVAGFAGTPLDLSDFPTRHPYGLALVQRHVERILAGWVDELGVRIARGRGVTGFTQGDDGVVVETDDGRRIEATYLIGCDGGRSLVRKIAGIDFPGWDPTVSNLIAEVEFRDEPEWGLRHDEIGIHGISRTEDGKTVGVIVTEREVGRSGEPTLRDLSEALVAHYGSDFGVRNPTSLSRFTDTTRQAASYRKGRVLLAGDAAHVHYPVGGQGLNLGIQDAVNLGWKLAQVVKGISPGSLLDTYHSERHPVAARVLQDTMAQVALRGQDARTKALGGIVSELLRMDEPKKRFAARMSGLDIRYELGDGHELLGRRMPDLDLVTAGGAARVFSFLHRARPVLFIFDAGGRVDIGAWADRVQSVEATYEGKWELPAVGAVSAPTATLVRPDGYVAWVGEGSADGLSEALTMWFGAA
jgi:2-polyprenyl-6-methoxyphenol hydroxylase-like FAD-dependent oxidoreductase